MYGNDMFRGFSEFFACLLLLALVGVVSIIVGVVWFITWVSSHLSFNWS